MSGCGLGFVLFLVAAIVSLLSADSPCVHTYHDKTIDLSKFLNFPVEKIADVSSSDFTYSVDLCTPLKCNDDRQSECACQAGGTQHGQPYNFSLGKSSTAKWDVISTNPLHLTVTCTDGETSDNNKGKSTPRSVKFEFKHSDATKGDNIKMSEQDPSTLQYTFSITIGGGGSGGGGSKVGYVGLVLIILALVGIITYFIVGGVYMYNIRGARGIEVVPNLSFWKEFPFLIKDGFVFTFGPLVRLVRGGHSYERI